MSSSPVQRLLRWGSVAALAALLLSTAALQPQPVDAAGSITVDRTDDTAAATACTASANDCSLRGAVIFANANPGTTIVLSAATYDLTINEDSGTCTDPTKGDLNVNGDGTIMQGAGATQTIIRQTQPHDRVICLNGIKIGSDYAPDFDFTLSGMTITGGRETHAIAGGGLAGGAFNNHTILSDCVFSNNQASGQGSLGGGAVSIEGGDLTINNCTFGGPSAPGASQTDGSLANSSTSSGGAISYTAGTPFVSVGPDGFSHGTLTITNSTFINNTTSGASGGGAIDFFDFNLGRGVGNISTSTFTANKSTFSTGGAIVAETGDLSVTTSTFTNNTAATFGGAVYSAGATVNVSYSRIVNNSAPNSSGVHGVAANTVTAINNWWGCSTGPSAAPCDRAGGTATFTPWLRVLTTATLSTIVTNQSTSLTASVNTNSNGQDVSANNEVLKGVGVTWSAVGGSLTGQQVTIQPNGTATASYQATAANAGNKAVAKIDNDGTTTGSNVASITVNKADTTTAITNGTSLASTLSVTGQPVAVSFSVTGALGNTPTAPTGNVTVSDGTDSCTATVAAGTCNLTFKTAGAKSLTATYAGDANFNASPASSSVSHTVNKADTTTTIASDNPDPSVTGQTVTFNVTVAAVAPGAAVAPTTITGSVVVSDGGTNTCTATLTAGAGSCTIALPNAALYSMTGVYGGDANFNSSTSAVNTHTVNKADTITTITSDNPDPSLLNQSVTVSYSVSVTSPGSGAPTGSVTVSDGVDSCSATVAAGTCDITLSTPGARTITAHYAGDSDFNGSTSAGVAHTVAVPDLTVSKSHTGDFTQGQTGAQYTITVTNNGAVQTSGTVTVVDTLPAGLTATAISGMGWTCTLATLTCTRSDALAASSSFPNITLTVNVSNTAPGNVSNSVTVSGGGEVDTSNDTVSDSTNVVADSTPPDTSVDSNPSNPSTSSAASFTFSGTDNATGVASFECQLDGGGFAACVSPQSYPTLADGSHTFQARAIDGAGNVDPSPASFTWTIDTNAPDTTIDGNPSNPSNTSSATFSFSGTDSGAGVASFECKLDVGSFVACTSPQTYSSLADESHTFQVRAIDGVGNVDSSPASFTWTVDTTPPAVTINQASSQADSTSASPIHFTVAFTEAVAGFTDGDVTLNGTAGATTAGVSEMAPFDGTTYDVSVSGMTVGGFVSASIAPAIAADAAGNGNLASTSTDNTVTFVPNAPPVADAGGPYSVKEGGSVVLDGTSSSDPDQVAASLTYVWDLDGDTIFGETGAAAANGAETGSAPTFVTAGLDGPSSVSVTLRVTDNANTSDDASVTITIVNTAPTASISGPSSGAVGQALTFALGASDPSAADQASTFSYAIDWDGNGSVDETLSGPNSRTGAHTYPQTGVFTVSMTATDKDGGVSASVSLTVTVRGGIHVGGIVMYVASCNGVPRSCVRAGVKPLTAQGQIVPGAVVTAVVTAPGRASVTLTATANAFGWASFDIPVSGPGIYILTVTNLTAPFLDYAPEDNAVTSASYRFDGAIRRR